jgi:PhnB protein
MKCNPYLTFDGRCKEAFEFYEQCLGGKIVMMQTHGESPIAEHVPREWHDSILHARLTFGDEVLMGCDVAGGRYEPPKGFYVTLAVDKVSDAERIFEGLADGGKVTMPFAETFWAVRFGMVTDRFGIPWLVNGEQRV